LILGFKLFFGTVKNPAHLPEKDASFSMIIAPLMLAVSSLVFGLFSTEILSSLIFQASVAILPGGEAFELGLWHGFNTALMLSLVTVATGATLYYFRGKLEKGTFVIRALHKVSPEKLYFVFIKALQFIAVKITSRLQSGYLRRYVTII